MNAAATLTDLLSERGGSRLTMHWTPGLIPGCGVLVIESRRDSTTYAVVELPTDRGGRSLRLEKVGGDPSAEVYAVLCSADGRGSRCDCRGFARHRRCKHLDAATGLVANRWV